MGSLKQDSGAAKNHYFENPFRVARLILSGKSITRSLFNLAIRRYSIAGKVLDLGSKNGSSSYYDFIKKVGECEIVYTDLIPSPGVAVVDVERNFPFDNEVFDTVISFHLMEHVYQFWKMPSEIFRVLKPNGRLIVSVPFIHEYHGDPSDYWRMSSEAVVRIFTEAGFRVTRCELVGEGIATFAATKIASLIFPGRSKSIAMALSYMLATVVDRLVDMLVYKLKGRSPSKLFAIDILCEFEKNVSHS